MTCMLNYWFIFVFMSKPTYLHLWKQYLLVFIWPLLKVLQAPIRRWIRQWHGTFLSHIVGQILSRSKGSTFSKEDRLSQENFYKKSTLHHKLYPLNPVHQLNFKNPIFTIVKYVNGLTVFILVIVWQLLTEFKKIQMVKKTVFEKNFTFFFKCSSHPINMDFLFSLW